MELVGLCMSALTWLENLADQKIYPYDGVSIIKDGKSVTLHACTARFVPQHQNNVFQISIIMLKM